MWDLNFTMKGYLYGPVNNQGAITRSVTNFYANTAPDTEKNSQVVIVPGLTADGKPTTNSAASIHRSLIDSDDDYGFAANTFFFG